MSSKAKRRFMVVVVALTISVLAAGTYIYRKYQVANELAEHRTTGMAAYTEQDYPQTIKELGQYLPRNPEDVEALLAYADSMRHVPKENGRHLTAAVGLFLRVTNIDPDNEIANREAMKLADAVGYVTEALKAAEKLLDKNPQDTEALLVKGRSLLRQGDTTKAAEVFDELLEIDPTDIDAHLLRMTLASRSERGLAAIMPRFDQYVAAHPNEPLFLALRGMAHTFQGDRELATKDFLAAAEFKPQSAKLVILLVQGMERVGLGVAAQKLLLLPDQVSDPDERYAMATICLERYQRQHNTEMIKTVIDQIDLQDPKVPARLIGLWSLHLIESERGAEAQPFIEMLTERVFDPTALVWAEALQAIADWRSGKQNVGQTISELTKITNRASREAFFHFELGLAYSEIGDDHLAMTSFIEAAKSAPGWVEPCIRGARAAMTRGLEAESIDLCREAIRRNPNNFSSLVAMAQAWGQAVQKHGTSEQNVASATRLLQLLDAIHKAVPNEPNTLGIYTLLVSQYRDKDQARELMNKAIAADPPLPGPVLLSLYQVSLMQSLGMQSEFLALAEKVDGLTPTTAYARALDLITHGKIEAAIAGLKQHAENAPADQKLQWQMIYARMLDQLRDKRALDIWRQLGDAHKDQANVQKALLFSAMVWQDREFVRLTIDRLREISSDEGLDWRVAEARWLLTKEDAGADEAAESLKLMQYVIERAPQRTESRLLLARAYQLQSNPTAAINELEAAVNQDPDNHQIRLTLARLAFDHRNYAVSKVHAKTVAQSKSALPLQRAAAAELLMRQGEIATAVATMESIEQRDESANMMLLLSRMYIAQGRMNDAGNLVDQLIKTSPSSDTIGLAIGFYAATGRRAELQSIVDQLAREKPEMAETALLLARGHLLLKQPDAAEAALRLGLENNPTNDLLWMALIELHVDSADGKAFATTVNEARGALPDNAGFKALAKIAPIAAPHLKNVLMKAMTNHVAQNPGDLEPITQAMSLLRDVRENKLDPDKAATQFMRLAESNTTIEPIQLTAARLCIVAGRYDKALDIARRAAEAFPLSTAPLSQVTEALLLDNQWPQVIAAAQRWRARLISNTYEPDRMIAMAYQRMGQSDRAAAVLRPHIRDMRKDGRFDGPLIFLYCQALVGADQVDQARTLLQSMIDTWPPITEFWLDLAANYIEDPKVAEEWLATIDRRSKQTREVSLQLKLAKAWHDLSNRTNDMSYLDRAKEVLIKLWDADQAKTQVAFWLGAVSQTGDDLDQAAQWYERALKLKPDYYVAANNLAMVLADQRRDLDRALKLAQDVAEASPTVPQFVDTVAYVLWKRGEHAQATKAAAKAIKLDPEAMVWRLRMAAIQLDGGMEDDARRTLVDIRRRVDRGQRISTNEKQQLEKLEAATMATANP